MMQLERESGSSMLLHGLESAPGCVRGYLQRATENWVHM